MKYKIGDRVIIDPVGDRVIIDPENMPAPYEGRVGTVIEVERNDVDFPILVEFESIDDFHYYEPDEIEYIQCKSCMSDKIWHDKKEIYFCPFCE